MSIYNDSTFLSNNILRTNESICACHENFWTIISSSFSGPGPFNNNLLFCEKTWVYIPTDTRTEATRQKFG